MEHSGLNVNNVLEKKNKILEILKNKGPSLPSTISREIGVSLLFTSALLSEMIKDKSLKCSHLKIGGSPLYYLEGQEQSLDNFVNHLQAKEKEAFLILKEAKVIDEEFLHPAHRVALRSIKDFAVPVKISVEGREKNFWRYHLIGQEEATKKIGEIFKKLKKERKETRKEVKEAKEKEKKDEIQKVEKKEEVEIREKEAGGKKPRVSKKKDKEDFYARIYEHLQEQGVEIQQEIKEGAVVCIALANFSFGKAKLLVVANNKKKISEADLSLAYQQGLVRKMPVLFLTQGELTKKASSYIEMLGNYIFVKKI